MSSITTSVHQLNVEGVGPVDVSVNLLGEGQAFLLLHGGAGPRSMDGFAGVLADTGQALVVTPTHPGFDGTPRPDALGSVGQLAAVYVALLAELGLSDVTVVGNSIGGWIAAEIALLGSARVARVVLVDATGIDVPGHPIADVFSMALDEVMDRSYHDAEKFRIDVSSLPPAAQAVAAGNRASLGAYGGPSSFDPGLRDRLSSLDLAALVVWGDSDRIVDPDYGRAYAAAIPDARFQLLADSGHVPQVETPGQVGAAVLDFASSSAAWTHTYSLDTSVPRADIWATLQALYTGTRLSDRGDTIEIHGPFEVGTTLSVTPLGADFVVECTIIEMVEGNVYAYQSEFNGLMITSRHSLTTLADGGTRITQQSIIAGPRAERLGPQIGARITEDHPAAMDDLVSAARTRSDASS